MGDNLGTGARNWSLDNALVDQEYLRLQVPVLKDLLKSKIATLGSMSLTNVIKNWYRRQENI